MSGDFPLGSFAAFGRLGPGGRVAGYVIEEQVGSGGMAVVFRARDDALGRVAALKVIAPQLAGNAGFRERFLRESRAAAVDSPYVVPVYGAGEDQGLLWIATRFVAGGNLAEVAARGGGRLAAGRVAALVGQVAAALDAAHAAGLVHRDVKPGNVLVDEAAGWPGHAYLTDFGISKAVSSTALTGSGQFLGTPDYAAPEQVRGQEVDGRADQYALGCVAYALLTGVPPFRRDDATATLYAHLSDPVPSVSARRPGLPAGVDAVVARALAKSPEDRYDTCGAFAAALGEALAAPAIAGKHLSLAEHPGLPEMAAAGPKPVPHADTVTVGGAGRPHGYSDRRDSGNGHSLGRGRALRAAGAALVLAAGAATAVALFNAPSPTPGPPGTSRSPSFSSAAGTGSPRPASSRESSRPAVTGAATGSILTSRVLSGSGYGFNGPTRVADDGTHVWVANSGEDLTGGDSVTELNASDGSLVRVLQGGSFGFNVPYGIAVYGAHVWITNLDGDSVTELNASDGSLVRVLAGGNYGFDQPAGISAGDGRVWVGNRNSVTVLNAADGSLVRVLPGGSSGIGIDGVHAWLTGIPNVNSVTELNAADGSLVRVLAGGDYGFKDTLAIAVDGPHVWVVNDPDALGDGGGDSVTELNAADGSLVRVLAGGSHDIKGTIDIAAGSNNIWVANSADIFGNGGGDWVTELNSRDGSLTRVLNGGSYGINDPIDIAADGNHVFVTSHNTSVTELTTG